MSHNRYGATLIQDTADFFYLAGASIRRIRAENVRPDMPTPEGNAVFYSWMFAHQIERVFDLTCEGHRRRAHPNVLILDQVRNLIDLDAITKATIRVPQIYDDQTLKVWLWHNDLVIQYCPYTPLDFSNTSFSANNFNI
jgi:hypothetical protein